MPDTMLISETHQFVLFLPQKSAASTLLKRLAPLRHRPACDGSGYFEQRLGRILSNHINQADARLAGFLVGRETYFKAAFVRNPYDRVFSWFRWFQRVSQERYEPGGLIEQAHTAIAAGEDPHGCKARLIRRTAWMRDAVEAAKGDVNRFYAAHPKEYSLASDFTHDQGRQMVDWIGHVECFEADFDRFCEQTGLRIETRVDANRSDLMPVIRSVERPLEMRPDEHDYLDRLTRISIQRINRNFAADFELLGYRRYKKGRFSGLRAG